MGTFARSLLFLTTALTGTIGYCWAMETFQDGLIVLASVMAWTTSSGDMLQARSRSGLRLMTMLRALPPKGGGADTPGSVAKMGRTRFKAASCNWPTVRVSLEKTRLPTGTLPASKRITNGGAVPGGINARARFA